MVKLSIPLKDRPPILFQYNWLILFVGGLMHLLYFYQAIKYIESLPLEKRPMKDSEGANFRKNQLEKQIPEHDINPAACDNLTPAEMQM